MGSTHVVSSVRDRAVHADPPAEDPRDKDDLVILGATAQVEVPLAELNINEETRQRLREAQKGDGDIAKAIEYLANPNETRALLRQAGVHRCYFRKQRVFVVKDGLLYCSF